MRYSALCLILIFVATTAQTPTHFVGATAVQTPTLQKSPCADTELRLAMAEALVAKKAALAEACALHAEVVEKENSRLKGIADSAGQSLVDEQRTSAGLVAVNKKATAKAVDLEGQLAAVTAERDELKRKIKAANGRFACEVFSIGCIK